MRQIINFSKEIVFKSTIAAICSISLEHEEKVYSGEINGEFLILGDYKAHSDTTTKENFKYRLPFSTLIPDNIDSESLEIEISNFTYEQIEADVLRVDIEYVVMGEEREKEVIVSDIDFLKISDVEGRDSLGKDDEEVGEEISAEEEVVEVLDINEEVARTIDEEIDRFLEEGIRDEVKVNDNVINNEVNIIGSKVMIGDDSNSIIDSKVEAIDSNKGDVEVVGMGSNSVVVDSKGKKEEDVEHMEIKDNDIKMEEYVTYHVHIMNNEDVIDSIVKSYNGNMDVVKELNDLKDIKMGSKVIIPEYGDE